MPRQSGGLPFTPIGAMLAGEVGSRGSTAAAQSAEAATAAVNACLRRIQHLGRDASQPWRDNRDHLGKRRRAAIWQTRCGRDRLLSLLPCRRAGSCRCQAGIEKAFSPRCAGQPRASSTATGPRSSRLDGCKLVSHRLHVGRAVRRRSRSGAPSRAAGHHCRCRGLDFLEQLKLERLEEAHQRGASAMCSSCIYSPNDIGDFQSGGLTHQGLTEFGAEVIRACRTGLLHLAMSRMRPKRWRSKRSRSRLKPLLLSHTALAGSPAMGPNSAERPASQPGSRACHRRDRRIGRHLAFLSQP